MSYASVPSRRLGAEKIGRHALAAVRVARHYLYPGQAAFCRRCCG